MATGDRGFVLSATLCVCRYRGTQGALVSAFHGDQRNPRRAGDEVWNSPLTLWYGFQYLPSKLLNSKYSSDQYSFWGCPWVAMAVTLVTLPRSTCSHSPRLSFAAQPTLLFSRASAAAPYLALLAVREELGREPSWSPSAELHPTEPQRIW